MAARTSSLAARRLISPALRDLFRRQAATLGAIALAFLGLAILVALATYDPRDPSLNTATPRRPSNLAGPPGAILADLLLQGFGIAGTLPGLALLAWAWRVGSGRGLGRFAARLAALLAALPLLSGAFGLIPTGTGVTWPSLAGLGGAVGNVLATRALDLGHAMAGLMGAIGTAALGVALGVTMAGLALGLSIREWRSAARYAGRFGRWGWRGGRRAVTAGVSAGATGVGSASSWVSTLVERQRGMRPDDEPVPAAPVTQPVPAARIAPDPPWEEPAPATSPAPRVDDRREEPAAARPRVHAPTTRPRTTREQLDLNLAEPGWRFPDLDLLKRPPIPINAGPNEDALQANARLLETVLDDYGVKGAIVEIRPGPVVTLYELEPAPGIRSARVIGLADDVARSLSVTAVRIATVPGRNVIGIEVPNARRETVFLQEILASDELRKSAGKLTLALGKDIGGTTVVADLARMPHLMIAGTTGSGKSVGVNAMILSLLYRLSPDQCRLILIDPKMLELSIYEGIPHLMAPVVTEPAKAVTALKWVVREM